MLYDVCLRLGIKLKGVVPAGSVCHRGVAKPPTCLQFGNLPAGAWAPATSRRTGSRLQGNSCRLWESTRGEAAKAARLADVSGLVRIQGLVLGFAFFRVYGFSGLGLLA